MTVSELAAAIGAELVGDGAPALTSAATLEAAGPGQVSFLSNRKYMDQLAATRASAVIVAPGVNQEGVTLLKTSDPYYAFSKAVVALHGFRQHPHAGVHPRAHVDETATLGEGTVVYPGAYVGPGAALGRDCILYPNATVYEGCVLGDRVIVHAGAAIGPDGFGYATHKGLHYKIPQVGNVVLEDDVEIGANACIARAALGSTVIARGTKIDALVMIGHGTRVGEHSILVAQVGVAGSCTIGHHVTLAGQVGVAGHLKIGNLVTVAAQGGVMADLDDQTIFMGSPAMPAAHARRVYSIFTQLPDLLDRVKKLEGEVGELSNGDDKDAAEPA
jgi:UDP-3-O-[3-hydroxymyristoyl] glucosamine N-acyltransferase